MPSVITSQAARPDFSVASGIIESISDPRGGNRAARNANPAQRLGVFCS
jgi:hypothetical protein